MLNMMAFLQVHTLWNARQQMRSEVDDEGGTEGFRMQVMKKHEVLLISRYGVAQ